MGPTVVRGGNSNAKLTSNPFGGIFKLRSNLLLVCFSLIGWLKRNRTASNIQCQMLRKFAAEWIIRSKPVGPEPLPPNCTACSAVRAPPPITAFTVMELGKPTSLPKGFCLQLCSNLFFFFGILMLVVSTFLIHYTQYHVHLFLPQRVYMYTSQSNISIIDLHGIPIQSSLTTLTCDTPPSVHFRSQWTSHNTEWKAKISHG